VNSNSPTLILDSNYLGHQARYAFRELNAMGTPTGVIFGFLSRVLHLGQMFHTNDVVFCWDSSTSLRKRLYPEYKAHRKPATPELAKELEVAFRQFRILREQVLPRIGFRNVRMQDGYEADDLIARMVHDELGEFVVVSADEDLYQLLQGNVRVYNPSSKLIMTRGRLYEEHGVSPSEWLRAKVVAGCRSDNVSGVPGVGMATALKWVKVELPSTSKTVGKILTFINDKEAVSLNTKLVTLPFEGTEAVPHVADSFSVRNFCQICGHYGFESFLDSDNSREYMLYPANDLIDVIGDTINVCRLEEDWDELAKHELVKRELEEVQRLSELEKFDYFRIV